MVRFSRVSVRIKVRFSFFGADYIAMAPPKPHSSPNYFHRTPHASLYWAEQQLFAARTTQAGDWRSDERKCHHAHALPAAAARPLSPLSSLVSTRRQPERRMLTRAIISVRRQDAKIRYTKRLDECKQKADGVQKQ